MSTMLQRIIDARRGNGWDAAATAASAAPPSPDSHTQLVAYEYAWLPAWSWEVGWVGSAMTIRIDSSTGAYCWYKHGSSATAHPFTASQITGSHLDWHQLPRDVRSTVRRAAERGPGEVLCVNTKPLIALPC